MAALRLSECGLMHIPAAVAALAGSLTSLELPYNNDLQLDNDDVECLLSLRKLRTLDLQKSPFAAAMNANPMPVLPAAE